MNTLKRFISEEEGLETVEYGVIAGLILVISLVTISALGMWVNDRFAAVLEALGDAGN